MNFDEQAVVWDDDLKKIERAKVVAKEIINFIQPDQKLTALEFGCGTGLLSFELKDSFKRITLADNSEGMIKVLKKKIKTSGVNNFDPILLDLSEEDINPLCS
jgi:ubiquinone/menaquinone biosynthesis C-methylase UbiE